MKLVLSLILSFLLIAFITKLPLAFSNDVEEPVLDIKGNPLVSGMEYYIMPAIFGPPGGGVRLGKTGDSKCPVTVLQDYSEVVKGIPVIFNFRDIISKIIFEGITQLEIAFTAETPDCAESSDWLVFVDNVIQKACVGIGGPGNYPGQQTLSGTFNIQNYGFGYKLVFCVSGSETCLDIGRFDNGEGGRRLNLTEHEPFEVVFVDSASYDEGIIRSVVA